MKTFADMTKPEKAVAIAKDVLKQLALRRYKATPGTYLRAEVKRLPPPEITIKDLKQCQVCAIGSAITSAARLGGQDLFKFLVHINGTEAHSNGYYKYAKVGPTERLRRIMRNIIRNQGRFIP